MKQLVENYTFDASAQTVEFDDFGGIDLDRILLITDVTENVIIYNFSDPAFGGTVATNVLTLTYDTTTLADTDKLQIFYEIAPGDPYQDVTLKVEQASTPLPPDAAQGSKQDTGNATLVAIDGHVDGLETAVASTNTKLDTLHADVDGLETAVASTNTKLDTVHADLGTIDGHVDGIEASVASIDAGTPAGLGQTTMSGSTPVAIASDQSVLPVNGGVAHDAVDSGNPVKIGGKASTTAPTPVAAADRVDAWFDEYGREVTSDYDPEVGQYSGLTGLRDKLVAQRYTVLADSLADGLATYWTQTTANGGTTTSSGGEGLIESSNGAGGVAQLVSTPVLYFPGQVGWFNSAVRFNDTGSANNIRRIGVFTVSGTTPQDGFYYELSGTTLNAVVCKGGVATAVASTSWSRFSIAPFTLDTNYHSFEIRYTANTVWFMVDNVLRHRVSGTTASITATLDFSKVIQSINSGGSSNRIIAVRNCGIGRFGSPMRPVDETGLSAVHAVAVGGGTPHDSVDSGNPLKTGGVARTSNPTAVAHGDRTNFIADKLGKQVTVGSLRELKATQQTTITSSVAETTIVTAVASTFLDLYGLIITNTSSLGTKVTIKDATAGTTRFVFFCPANDTRGFMLNESAAAKQAVVNNNWTATCGTSVNGIEITALTVANV